MVMLTVKPFRKCHSEKISSRVTELLTGLSGVRQALLRFSGLISVSNDENFIKLNTIKGSINFIKQDLTLLIPGITNRVKGRGFAMV